MDKPASEVVKVMLTKGVFSASIPPLNGSTGTWDYNVVVTFVDGKPTANVTEKLPGVRASRSQHPITKISEQAILSLVTEIGLKHQDMPAKRKGRAGRNSKFLVTQVDFDVLLNGKCEGGADRILEANVVQKTMTIPESQPDGRTFWVAAPEKFTVSFRRKTEAGKGQWREWPCASIRNEEISRLALLAEAETSWAPPKQPTPKTNTLPGYSEPPCGRCGKGIGKQASYLSFPPDPTKLLLCSRCSTIAQQEAFDAKRELEHHRAPDDVLQAHLTKKRGPYKKVNNSNVCTKCNKTIKTTGYEIGFIPTQEMICLCPSCWSKATLHDGWRCQLDFN